MRLQHKVVLITGAGSGIMSSCIAEIGLMRRAAYAASKGAVLALTKSMQSRLRPVVKVYDGITALY